MENQPSNPILPETPIMRINGRLLGQSIGSKVSIVGTVESVSGTMVTIRSSDNINVTINAPTGFTYPQGKVVEVIGTASNNGTIIADVSVAFEDAEAYNKLIEYMNGKFHDVF